MTSPTILKDGTTSIEPETIYEVPYGTTIKVNVQNWNQLLNTGVNGWTWNWDKKPEGINKSIAASDQHFYECELKGNNEELEKEERQKSMQEGKTFCKIGKTGVIYEDKNKSIYG